MKGAAEIIYPRGFAVLSIVDAMQEAAMRDITNGVATSPIKDDRQTVQQVVRHLLNKGLVQSERDESRAFGERVRWSLTDRGQEVLTQSRPYYVWVTNIGGEPGSGSVLG